MYHLFYHWLDWWMGSIDDTVKSIQPKETVMDYLEGKFKPHYPVPATMDTAVWSVIHQWEYNLLWLGPWTIRKLQRKLSRQ